MATTIAVDYRMCRASGIGVYLRTIVRHLVSDTRCRVIVLGGDDVPGAVDHVPCGAPVYSIAELIEVPLRSPRSADVFWSPNYNAPLVSPGRLVVTVHDANHLALPHLLGNPLKRAYAAAMFRNVKRRASRVIAVSQFTASELERLAGIPRDRMTVIHSGVGAEWTEAATPPPTALEGPYVLYVGNVKPHKNLSRLLDAFAHLAPGLPHRLVIVGKREGFITPDGDIGRRAEQLGSRVVFTGEVPMAELRGYYEHADLLVYPSLYEGFGFPPLEAMAAGLPVAASRAASIPEVCGDAAAYFDPLSVEDMARVIAVALTDAPLRERLRTAGRARVAAFSWKEAATRTTEVLLGAGG